MSNATSDNAGAGRKRRRSRGGRNRNRNRNRQGQQGQGNRNESSRSSRDGGGNRGRRSGGRRPEPVKLTWWQKLLKAIGLYKEPERPARGKSPKSAPKSNTRVAKAPSEKREDETRESRKPETIEPESNRLYLGNLSYEATESDLEELFKGVGTVRAVEIVYNRRTHRSKGYGFVDMLGVDEAKRAVEVLHDQFFMGRRLVVSGAKSQGPADDADDDGDDGDDETPSAS